MRTTMIAVGFALMVTLAGCGDDPEVGPTSTTSTTSVSPSASPSAGGESWIAVIEVASDPNDLDALTERLRQPLGTALVVAPVDCFEGLPETADAGYLIGAVGEARSEAERDVVDAGETVTFSAHVTILCTD